MSAQPILIDCEQRSSEWHAARLGKATCSQIAKVFAKGKTKNDEAAGRKNYRAQIVAEILTGVSQEDPYVSPDMQWGIDQEPFARAAYELQQDVMVAPVGFIVHSFIERFGGSPDGLVGDEGMLELKCPKTATHLEWMIAGVVPAEHQPQMFSNLACAGPSRLWCDFVSFDPRLPAHLQLFIRRLYRDDTRIAAIEGGVIQFLAEVDDVLVQLGAAAVSLPNDAQPIHARARLLATEIKTAFEFYFPGKAKQTLLLRTGACDLIFGMKSPELLYSLPWQKLERGLRILHAYQKFPQHDLASVDTTLSQIAIAITEYDQGLSEEWEH